jgi:mycothiol system anti-sigma-R factor
MISQPDPDRRTPDPDSAFADRALSGDPGDCGDFEDCAEMVARLYVFLDNELPEDRRNRIQAHLERCPSCYGAFDFEAELRMVVARRLRSNVPPELADRIRLSLTDQGDGPRFGGPSGPSGPRGSGGPGGPGGSAPPGGPFRRPLG